MGIFQQLVQEDCIFIVADEAGQEDVAVEISQIRGYVGSPAQDGRHVIDFIDRHRRFRRNAFDLAEHIAPDLFGIRRVQRFSFFRNSGRT